MNRTEAQRRADAITILRTANLEGVSTVNLQRMAWDLQSWGAVPQSKPPTSNPSRPE